MIGDILNIITREVSEYIDSQNEFLSGGKTVVLAKPSGINGGLCIPDNSIALSLINIDEESSMRNPVTTKRVEGNKVYSRSPGISLNLSIIFIANFPNDYASELNYITKIIEFFQKKDTFTLENTLSLKKYEKYIDKLVFKLATTSLSEQNHTWNLLGIKYMPSVMFTVGKIKIQEDEKLSETKVTQRIHRKVEQK
ncbi:MAG: DUF4255 domain-containing protein [Campylobacteraceae bacterium]|nr:DUF4255 domain-containing protein [Campylobacteraceae bacterium]